MTAAQENLLKANDELKNTIHDGTTTAERLKGDLRTATEAVRTMRQQSDNLTQQATRACKVATREYAQVRGEAQAYHQQLKQDLQELGEQVKANIPDIPSPAPNPHRPRNSDEYIIDGMTVAIRTKKYQEDHTPITCTSKDHLITTYDHIANVARQYGIYITDLRKLEKWLRSFV